MDEINYNASTRKKQCVVWDIDEKATLDFYRRTGGNPGDFGFSVQPWTPNGGANPLTLEAVQAKVAQLDEWAEQVVSLGLKPCASAPASSEEETERSLALLMVLSEVQEFKRKVQATPEVCGLEEPVFDENNPLTLGRATKIVNDLREARKGIIANQALHVKVKKLQFAKLRVVRRVGASLKNNARAHRSAPRPLESRGEKSSPGDDSDGGADSPDPASPGERRVIFASNPIHISVPIEIILNYLKFNIASSWSRLDSCCMGRRRAV